MLHIEDTELGEMPLPDGLIVPRVRMTTYGLPEVEIMVGEQQYEYDRSLPIKGQSATLPKLILSLLAENKKPLVLERPERFYIYVQK
jgi:hypothetical protein